MTTVNIKPQRTRPIVTAFLLLITSSMCSSGASGFMWGFFIGSNGLESIGTENRRQLWNAENPESGTTHGHWR